MGTFNPTATEPTTGETYSALSGGSNKTSFTTEKFNWRIWDLDENNDRLVLIADGVTSTKLNLAGPSGYNNAVKLLDDICYTCYSNDELGAVGRSFSFDYIEAKLKTKPTYTKSTITWMTYGNGYPVIYEEEWYSQVGGDKSYIPPGEDYAMNERALSNSQQKVYYKTTSGSTGKGYSKSSLGISPTNTYFEQSYTGATNRALFSDERHAYMVSGKGNTETGIVYWLSSRAVVTTTSSGSPCTFKLRMVGSSGVLKGESMMSATGTTSVTNRIYSARPIVCITLSSIVLGESGNSNESTGWSIRKS